MSAKLNWPSAAPAGRRPSRATPVACRPSLPSMPPAPARALCWTTIDHTAPGLTPRADSAVNQAHYNIVHYLSLTTPPREETMKRALFALVAAVSVTAPAFADQALATSKNCMACHAVDKKLVGPAFKDIATKYKGDKSAADKLATKVIKGGSGVWGPVPMPANAQVSEAESKK